MAKILLVEDDNNLREIYEARLAAEGYEIVSARDGEEALTVAMKEKPDLIISDVMMPKISGFDMLDILRTTEETKNAKIIMMTALSQAEDKERAEKLGADRYLVKSQVTLEDVAKVARDVLEGRPAEEQTPSATASATTTTSPPEPAQATDDTVTVTTPAPQSAAESTTDQPTSSAIPTPAPAPEPTQSAQPEPATTPQPATPAVAASSPDPTPAVASDNTAGLDAVASAQPTPVPAAEPTVAAPTTPVPVGTPSDNTTVAPDPAATATSDPDPVDVSVKTEEQIIAQQIKDSLNISKTPQDSASTPVDPVMNAEPAPSPDTAQNTSEEPAAQRESTEATLPVPESSSPSAPRKKIEPINDVNAPGPDLEALAAAEEAKTNSPAPAPPQQTAEPQAPAPEPTVIQPTAPNPAQTTPLQPAPVAPPTDQKPSEGVDPNSIAL